MSDKSKKIVLKGYELGLGGYLQLFIVALYHNKVSDFNSCTFF